MPRFPSALRTTAAAVLVMAAIGTGPAHAQGQPAGGPPPAKVAVQPVESRLMAPAIEVPGTIHSRQDAEIAAEVAGRVVWVAEAGTRVAAGDAIARLDDRMLALEAEGLEAQIASLRSQVDFQTREVGRLRELAAKGSAPQSRLEEAQSRLDVLSQDLVRARVGLERTRIELERTVVKAPFAGQIAARMIEVGEYSAPGADVARLVAVDDVEVRAPAPVSLAGSLREGMPVQLTHDGGVAEGRISRIIPVGEERSRTFEVRVALPDGRWIVGGPVKVALPSAVPTQVVAVHRDALVLRGTGTYLFRVNAENKAERLTVRTGTAIGNWIEVEGDVAPGDRVVIRGAERLREGQSVDMDPRVS